MGPLISGNDSRIVHTFNLNVEDMCVDKVCHSYLVGHLNDVMCGILLRDSNNQGVQSLDAG